LNAFVRTIFLRVYYFFYSSMTSLNYSVSVEGSSPELPAPNGGLPAQPPRTDSPKPIEQPTKHNSLKPVTPSRSVQNSSVSSTPKAAIAGEDDQIKIEPALSNGYHDPHFPPLRKRWTRRATISEHTEAWDMSYVFSFGSL
jgi:hypothetical protein